MLAGPDEGSGARTCEHERVRVAFSDCELIDEQARPLGTTGWTAIGLRAREREAIEHQLLASAATKADESQGRGEPEEDDEFRTVQIGLKQLRNTSIDQVNVTFAGVVIAVIPLAILLLVFQKQLVRGLTAGAVKG